MDAITSFASRTVVLPRDNIDTDQIIPARFLTTTGREGLGQHAFADWRFDRDGCPRADFVLNEPAAAGCDILVAGHNFGCGSSREHAPWALLDFGLRAIISTGIADIFRGNALRNGLLPIVVDTDSHRELLAAPGAEITIDLDACLVTLPGGRGVTFEIDAFARYCLTQGIDPLGFLLDRMADITRYEEARQWKH